MKKLFFSLVLMFFVCMGSVRVYGFYQDTKITQLTDVNTHQLLAQSLVTDEHKNLVPKGSILGINDTEEFVFEYQVFVQQNLEIEYTIDHLSIMDQAIDEELVYLFNFEFESSVIEKDSIQTDLLLGSIDGYFLNITLTITMNEPTHDQFQLIANQPLSFDVIFSVK